MDVPSVFNRWIQVEKLGSGMFGNVYKARRENAIDDTLFAVKVASKGGSDDQALRREIAIHSSLTHPDIVRYVNSFDIRICGGTSIMEVPTGMGACVAMVLELLPGMNVEQMIKERNRPSPEEQNSTLPRKFTLPKGLELNLVKRLAKQLTSALSYLEEMGIVHKDIKASNILSDEETNFKLADFGFASKIGVGTTKNGTPFYMAPEIILQKEDPKNKNAYFFGSETDIWAMGITLFYALHGYIPWRTSSSYRAFIVEMTEGKIYRHAKSTEPEDFTSFLDGCLNWNIKKRLTPKECLEHSFLRDFKPKSPTELSEEAIFASDLAEFGEGTRDEFYVWLARKYSSEPNISLVRFNELYDGLDQ
jgi:serine/threonine protein kinase